MFRQYHKHKKYVIRKQASRITYSIFPYKNQRINFAQSIRRISPSFKNTSCMASAADKQ